MGSWLCRHTARLSEPDEIQQDQWCGYYAYKRFPAIDPPMTAVEFHIGQSVTDDPPVLLEMSSGSGGRSRRPSKCLSGSGSDGIGNFRLRGVITYDGQIRLRKTYISSGITWDVSYSTFSKFGYAPRLIILC